MKKVFLSLLIAIVSIPGMKPLFGQTISSKSQPGKTIIIQRDSVIVGKDEIKEKPQSRFEAGISYINNDVYLGRKDSSLLSYYTPSLSYFHKSGLFITASMNYLNNSEESRIDLITVEAGYIFNTGNYDGQLSLSKFIYNAQTTNISSDIQTTLSYQSGFDAGFIKPTLDLNLNIGTKIDYLGSFGLQHSFSGLHNRLEITPTFIVNGGTQNFYNSYYKNKLYSNRNKGKNSQNGTFVSASIANAGSFRILDYEASVPFSYTINKLVINFTPTYAIPVNPASINIQTRQSNGASGNKSIVENNSNSFYWTIGLTYKIK